MKATSKLHCHTDLASRPAIEGEPSTKRMRRRSSALLVRELDQEILLLDTEFDKIHHLNQTASFIWQRCDDVLSAADLAQLLANQFEVEEDRALGDVLAMLRKLESLNLIVEAS